MTSKSDFSSSPPPASPPAGRGGRRGHGHGRGRRHAEALLEVLQQLAQLDHRELGDPVEDLFFGQGCHLPGLPFFASVLCWFGRSGVTRTLFGGGRRLWLRLRLRGGLHRLASARRRPPRLGAAASARRVRPRLRRRPAVRSRRLGAASALVLGGQRLAAGLALLDQRRDPVGHVARQGLQEAGHLLHRRGQGAGQAGQQHLAGRQVGQRGQVAGREERPVGQPALDHQERVGPGEVPQGLGHGADVALHEGQRARAAEVLRQRLVLAAVDGQPDQRVLEDPVVAPGGGQRGAQLGQLGRRSGRGTRSRWRPSPRSMRVLTSSTTSTLCALCAFCVAIGVLHRAPWPGSGPESPACDGAGSRIAPACTLSPRQAGPSGRFGTQGCTGGLWRIGFSARPPGGGELCGKA